MTDKRSLLADLTNFGDLAVAEGHRLRNSKAKTNNTK